MALLLYLVLVVIWYSFLEHFTPFKYTVFPYSLSWSGIDLAYCLGACVQSLLILMSFEPI